jgi:hypothetical protein
MLAAVKTRSSVVRLLRLLPWPVAFGIAVTACGSTLPPPSDRLASAEAASRSARELGAEKNPTAALHLKLAQEQIESAKKLMTDGDNRRADLVLQRAGADAELSVMLAKESSAKSEAEKAQEKLKQLKGAK